MTELDQHLNNILKASGSGLKNYSMQKTLDDMRNALKAAIAAEREACAKEADEYATYGGSNFYDSFKKLAAIIRARGEEEDTKWIFEQMRGTRGAE
jgi:precorrin-2 methylase